LAARRGSASFDCAQDKSLTTASTNGYPRAQRLLLLSESFFLGVKKTIQNYPPISTKSAYGGRNFYKLKDVCEKMLLGFC